MPGDHSRFSYDPLRDFTRVRAQQGRVLLDADLNELADGVDHRLRALAFDVLGRCTAPFDFSLTPPAASGFGIAKAGTSFTIGLGRLYVHGLVLDNHGTPPLVLEPGLKDRRGAAPTPYENQPYFPQPPAIPAGRHVVYVDAWDREVTAVEDPSLIDPAVAVDTASRMQTVWQVKVLDGAHRDVTCATPDAEVDGWAAATSPSAGRLTVTDVGVPAATDPCSVPPDGGYRGWDNRLYRVEVHTGGPLAAATFKWSRDNASVATAVAAIDGTRKVLTVASTGRDDVQRIREQAWVEVMDEAHELKGIPGFLTRVETVDAVDDMTQTLTLRDALPADFPVDEAARTRVRQWDHDTQTGTVACADAIAGLVLEHGIEVTFSADPLGGDLRTGDYWTFAARSADASVEQLTADPPHGPIHFYGRLAVLDAGPEPEDCRTIWPPEGGCGDCGDCTITVSQESHETRRLTIQGAIDRVRETGGTVCLAPGRYVLDEPVLIDRAKGLRVRGHGISSVVVHEKAGPAIAVTTSADVQLRDFTILLSGALVERAEPARPMREDRRPEGARPEPEGGEDAEGEEARRLRLSPVEEIRRLRLRENLGTEGRGPSAGERAAARSLVVGVAVAQSLGVVLDGCVIADSRLLRVAAAGPATFLPAGGFGVDPRILRQWAQRPTPGAAVVVFGPVAGLAVRDCLLASDIGVAPWHALARGVAGEPTGALFERAASKFYAVLAGFELEQSVVLGVRAGLWLDEATQILVGATVHDSLLIALGGVGMRWEAAPVSSGVVVRDSVITGRTSGLECMAGAFELAACRVSATGTGPRGGPDGQLIDGDAVVVTDPPAEGALEELGIRDCRLDAARYGVALEGELGGIVIRGNTVRAGLGGVVMLPKAQGRRIVVEANDVRVTGADVPELGRAGLVGIWLVQTTLGEVTSNRIHDLGAEGAALNRVAVLLEHCVSAVVRGNTITDYMLGRRPRTAAGIAAFPFASSLDILDNVILVQGDGPVAAADDGISVSPISLQGVLLNRVGKPVLPGIRGIEDEQPDEDLPARHRLLDLFGEARYAVLPDAIVRIVAGRVWRVVLLQRPAVAVRGNRVDTHGTRAAVYSRTGGAVMVSDNMIRHAGVERGVGAIVDHSVHVRANSLVANANHIDATAGALYATSRTTAITGNVVRGVIEVNGNPLGPPWNGLNATLP